MFVTPLGIVVAFAAVASLKCKTPDLVTLAGIVTVGRLVQEKNALSAMSVTPFGIVMLVRRAQ